MIKLSSIFQKHIRLQVLDCPSQSKAEQVCLVLIILCFSLHKIIMLLIIVILMSNLYQMLIVRCASRHILIPLLHTLHVFLCIRAWESAIFWSKLQVGPSKSKIETVVTHQSLHCLDTIELSCNKNWKSLGRNYCQTGRTVLHVLSYSSRRSISTDCVAANISLIYFCETQ